MLPDFLEDDDLDLTLDNTTAPRQTSASSFLATCTVIRALRPLRLRSRKDPLIIGLIVPPRHALASYEAALTEIQDPIDGQWGMMCPRMTITHCTSETGRQSRRSFTYSEGFRSMTLGEAHLVALTHAETNFPQGFEEVADSILEIPDITARDVNTAARLYLKLELSDEIAEQASRLSLKSLALLMDHSRPMSLKRFQRSLNVLLSATESPESTPVKGPPKPTIGPMLEELSGFGEAADWAKRLKEDLELWRSGKIGWDDVDRGLLLSGPSGCGKTTFARALANSCVIPLIHGSSGKWQATGHLGDMLKAMRAAFHDAKKQAPSILFIDEIDSFGDRQSFGGQHRDYSTQVVAALLECMDGIEKREGVIIIGAANYPDNLDTALRRPGRLDRHIALPLPDAGAREGILHFHSRGQLAHEDLSEISARTDGWTGAKLEQLVRDAKRRARTERRVLEKSDLAAGLPMLVPIPVETQWRIAIHEAGHAIVAFATGNRRVERLHIERHVDSALTTTSGGKTWISSPLFTPTTRNYYLAEIAIQFGGAAAEEIILGNRTDGSGKQAGSDLHSATFLAVTLEMTSGLGHSLIYCPSEAAAHWLAQSHIHQERVEHVLRESYERAVAILKKNRVRLHRLAQLLLHRGTLSEGEIAECVRSKRGPRLNRNQLPDFVTKSGFDGPIDAQIASST